MHGTLSTRAPAHIPTWTEATVARLMKLNADGYTAREIAACLNADFGMNVTRNAVLGKVDRLGIASERGRMISPDDRADRIRLLDAQGLSRRQIVASVGCAYGMVTAILGPLPEEEAKARRVRGKKAADPTQPWFQPGQKIERVTGLVAESRPVTLMELDMVKACRWPLGEPSSPDFRYCGADKIEGRSYCGAHCMAAYTIPRKPVQEKRPVYRTEQMFRRFA